MDLKKIYGDNFASFNWKLSVLSIQAIFMLSIVEKLLERHIKEKTLLPRIPLVVFKILSLIIQNYKDKTEDELESIVEFKLSEMELKMLTSILGSSVHRNRFYANIMGTKDGNAKLIEDIDEEERTFIIHKDINIYLKQMIERIREAERERKR